MKKVLLVLVIIIVMLLTVACRPLIMINYYGDKDTEAEQTVDSGLWQGTQPEYSRTANGIGYQAADGYKWAKLDESIIGGYLLYLGNGDCIDNWKQVPMAWKSYE